MSEKIYLGRKVKRLQSSPEYGEYTKVRMITGDSTYVEAGDDTGLTLEVECPYATTEIAQSVLASISGYHYRPYEAESARLEPDAEIGDGITTAGFYGGIYQMRRRFGRHSTSSISAPQNSEADHEVQYKSEADRKFNRKMKEISSELAVKVDEISAYVEGEKSFEWSLKEDCMQWKANGSEIMRISADGLEVKGTIKAGSIISDGSITIAGVGINAATLRQGASSGYDWSNIRYGNFPSMASYSLTGGGYGFNYNAAAQYQVNGPDYFTCGSIGVRGSGVTYYFSRGITLTINGHSYTLLGYENGYA